MRYATCMPVLPFILGFGISVFDAPLQAFISVDLGLSYKPGADLVVELLGL